MRFLVVETFSFSADRLGGRIFTHEESRSQCHPSPSSSCEEGVTTTTTTSGVTTSRPLELGAQWLHGTVGNPLFDFCVEEGIFDSQGEEKSETTQVTFPAPGLALYSSFWLFPAVAPLIRT